MKPWSSMIGRRLRGVSIRRPHFNLGEGWRKSQAWVVGRTQDWGRAVLWSGGMSLVFGIMGSALYLGVTAVGGRASEPEAPPAGVAMAAAAAQNLVMVEKQALSDEGELADVDLGLFSQFSASTVADTPPNPFQPLPLVERRPVARTYSRAKAYRPARNWQAAPLPLLPVTPHGLEQALGTLPALPGVVAPGAAAVPLVEPAAPKEKPQPMLTGIIHGDPPLVVVSYRGKSYFLKIGEPLADNWILASIKEQSAVFNDGERAIEISIAGGK